MRYRYCVTRAVAEPKGGGRQHRPRVPAPKIEQLLLDGAADTFEKRPEQQRCLDLQAHNRMVGGSSPPGPANHFKCL